jgi:hypothetical protein
MTVSVGCRHGNCASQVESFVLRGVMVNIVLPTCRTQGMGGRIRKFVDAIEDLLGIQLIHENDALAEVGCFSLPSGNGTVSAFLALQALQPAYESPWTRYYEASHVEAVIAERRTACGWCSQEYDGCLGQTDYISGWNRGYDGTWFCSPLCRWSELKRWAREQRRKESEGRWLKEARRRLVETRRLLKSPPYHEASASQREAFVPATTSQT